ncbi:hypothetical protein [Pelagibacterium montanilacus]|uniref:hypothetical protein n=1 Tax=Pelagibacterium montanilacus TaxID=2185280 RepID=UPI000F8C88D5|nr:hypothetical protein [Pelagibacterium montanilacus]
MPERRHEHAAELQELGLAAPDDTTMHYLWQIVDEGVLGASRHVKLSNELMAHLIETHEDGVERARLVAGFIARTRGHDTPVIGNNLQLLLAGLDAVPAAEQARELRERIARWDASAAERKQRLVASAVSHLSGARGILAFDYSSTVAAIVIAMAKDGQAFELVVPESRAIAGGARYLEDFLPAGLSVSFIPDAAIEHGMQACDAALFGIETLRADGSFLNTIGSRMIARLAGPMGVEIYGATDMLKLDRRSYGGHRPSPAIRTYDGVLKTGIDMPGIETVTTRAPELEVIPANLVTSILTEHGPVPPAAIWALGREMFDMDKGEPA